jgi:Effector-associated domain 11
MSFEPYQLFLTDEKQQINLMDTEHIRSLVRDNDFDQIFEQLKQSKTYRNRIDSLISQYNALCDQKRRGIIVTEEFRVGCTKHVERILDLVSQIEENNQKTEHINIETASNINEKHLIELETYLTMKNNFVKTDAGTPIQSYFFLQDIFNIIEQSLTQLRGFDLDSTSDREGVIIHIKGLEQYLTTWMQTLEKTKAYSESLYNLLDEIERLCHEIKDAYIRLLRKEVKSNSSYKSKTTSLSLTFEELLDELKIWLKQAGKYQYN